MIRPMIALAWAILALTDSSPAAGAQRPDKFGPIYLDPADARPDYDVQGEYVGRLRTAEGDVAVGVQVIAMGDGRFRAVGYRGGLPGAGWDGGERHEAEGLRQGGQTTFQDESGARAAIRGGRMTVLDRDGELLGTLKRIVRKSPTLGAKPPEGAVVLFDGTGVEQFENARMTPDGLLMEPATSKRKFQSCRCHVEFRVPFMPKARGQARGNNGFFCQGRYQVQILDSFGLPPGKGECGAIYGVAAPRVNMCFPPLTWQTFDVEFAAAVFENGRKVRPARMTVWHNGVLVHQDVELPDVSAGALIKEEGPDPGPIYVQSHNAPLRFRNIWVLPR